LSIRFLAEDRGCRQTQKASIEILLALDNLSEVSQSNKIARVCAGKFAAAWAGQLFFAVRCKLLISGKGRELVNIFQLMIALGTILAPEKVAMRFGSASDFCLLLRPPERKRRAPWRDIAKPFLHQKRPHEESTT
jgi:hypothetical protein